MNKIVGGIGIHVVPGYQPYISQTGIVRWNSNLQSLEVMGNGNEWYRMDTVHDHIQLDDRVLSILSWAEIKMKEDENVKALCEKHVGLKDLKEKFEIMLALVQIDEEHTNK